MKYSRNKENLNFISHSSFNYNKRFLHKHQSKLNDNRYWCNMEKSSHPNLYKSFGNALNSQLMEKIALKDLAYEDLASMTDIDLKLIGFEHQEQRSALIEIFKHLPNQQPSYESILNSPEAQKLNNKILNNTLTHLKCMNAVLATADSKLYAEGDIMDDKQFVCGFIIETLNQLNSLSAEIDKEAKELKKQILNTPTKNRRKTWSTSWMVLTTLATSILAVLCYLKLKKQQFQ